MRRRVRLLPKPFLIKPFLIGPIRLPIQAFVSARPRSRTSAPTLDGADRRAGPAETIQLVWN
jgi:hypothetical protein